MQKIKDIRERVEELKVMRKVVAEKLVSSEESIEMKEFLRREHFELSTKIMTLLWVLRKNDKL